MIGLGVVAFGTSLGRRALLIGAIPPAAAVVWLATHLPDLLDGDVVSESTAWAPALGLTIDLRLDGFAALMVVLVSGIGVAVFAYGMRYFGGTTAALGRLAGLLTLFAGSMLGVVLADHLMVLYTCWELTSITSYLLIGNDHTSAKARAAALHALLVTSTGGLVMLGGFVVLAQSAGTYRLSEILAAPPSGTAISVALVLILVGIMTKSAQYPFHGWLPGAMAAPTPVSAYLHSATMVKAGIYLLARLAPVFAVLGFWQPLLIVVGLGTMIAGGLRAMRQTDLKLLLAFGTVSQLGFMALLFGLGTRESIAAGCILILAHGLFKAALFMVVGILDHQTGTRDIGELPALDRRWWPVVTVAVVSAASMAGLPALFGFIAKEAAYEAVLELGLDGSAVVAGGLAFGSAITMAYSIRFLWGAFVFPRTRQPERSDTAENTGRETAPPPPPSFVAPAVVLALPTVVLGLVPGLLDRFFTVAGRSLDAASEPAHLSVWHGVNTALILSLAAIAAGTVLFAARARLAPVLAAGSRIPGSADVYLTTLRALNAVANRATGVVQNGSVPIYTAVILLTAAVLPLVALITGDAWAGWPDAAADPGHVLVASIVIGSAMAAALIRRRLTAVLFLGVTGYGMAALFLIRGAPDLALTQVTIETLSTVMFVLVLHRLPDRFERASPKPLRVLRIVIAGMVGVGIFVFALIAGETPVVEQVSDEIVARAYPDGNGRNIVNVILVDFRALDTMGEITVLAAAAIGAVALARVGRRPRHLDAEESAAPDVLPDVLPDVATDGNDTRGIEPPRMERIVILDRSVRVLFHAVLVASLYFLFVGHNQPGGGFVGGLVAGAAVAMQYVAGGIDEVRRLSRFRPWTILGAGLLLAAVTAVVPLLFGEAVLETALFEWDAPILGTMKTTSALVFDSGVYLLVVGLVLMVFEAFGDEPVPEQATARPREMSQ